MAPTPEKKGKTIVFIHPDLGIGGAERLVVDAAVGLQKRGYKVIIFTNHCDPRHCFDEARDGTLDVRVRGDTLIPPTIFSRFAILCATLRQLHLIYHAFWVSCEFRAGHDTRPDAFFIDQLSAGLPYLRWLLSGTPTFFYCHFPDQLLAQGREHWWRAAYRVPFDALEQWSMGFADAIAVNSAFTRGVVARTWPGLAGKRKLEVVYPCIDTRVEGNMAEVSEVRRILGGRLVVSVNRFERKKDVALAIRAFAGLSKEQRKGARLVVAGGYDRRVGENVSYHDELVKLADKLGLANATIKRAKRPSDLEAAGAVEVVFLLSVPHGLKDALLRAARLLVYTPANEHFGIVPLEAMLRGVPVLAANTGGPTETVVEGKTGWLRDPEKVDGWTQVMDKVLNGLGGQELKAMARAGRERVTSRFGDVQMAETLDRIFQDMEGKPRQSSDASLIALFWVGFVAFFAASLAAMLVFIPLVAPMLPERLFVQV